nr:hypothetical protein [Candidatus Sigynarchaeum springense]
MAKGSEIETILCIAQWNGTAIRITEIPVDISKAANEISVNVVDIISISSTKLLLLGESLDMDVNDPYRHSRLILVDIALERVILNQRLANNETIDGFIGFVDYLGSLQLACIPSNQQPSKNSNFLSYLIYNEIEQIFKLNQVIKVDKGFIKDGSKGSYPLAGEGMYVIDPPDWTRLRYVFAIDTWAVWLNAYIWLAVLVWWEGYYTQLGWTFDYAGYVTWTSQWGEKVEKMRDRVYEQTTSKRRQQQAHFTIAFISVPFDITDSPMYVTDISGWRISCISLWNINTYAAITAFALAAWQALTATSYLLAIPIIGLGLFASAFASTCAILFIIYYEFFGFTYLFMTMYHVVGHIIGYSHIPGSGAWEHVGWDGSKFGVGFLPSLTDYGKQKADERFNSEGWIGIPDWNEIIMTSPDLDVAAPPEFVELYSSSTSWTVGGEISPQCDHIEGPGNSFAQSFGDVTTHQVELILKDQNGVERYNQVTTPTPFSYHGNPTNHYGAFAFPVTSTDIIPGQKYQATIKNRDSANNVVNQHSFTIAFTNPSAPHASSANIGPVVQKSINYLGDIMTVEYLNSIDIHGINRQGTYIEVNGDRYYDTDGDGSISVDLSAYPSGSLSISLYVFDQHPSDTAVTIDSFVVENSGVIGVTIDHQGASTDADPGFWEVLVTDSNLDIDVFIDNLIQEWNHMTSTIYTTPNSLGNHQLDAFLGASLLQQDVVSISDDDVLSPLIDIQYIPGDGTDANPGYWNWAVTDTSGIQNVDLLLDGQNISWSGICSGTIPIPNIAGTHTLEVIAEDDDKDRPNDSLISLPSSNEVTILDDDNEPPEIIVNQRNMEITDSDTESWIVDISDASGLDQVIIERTSYRTVDTLEGPQIEEITTTLVNMSDISSFHGEFPIPHDIGAHRLTIYARDGDNEHEFDYLEAVDSVLANVTDDDLTPPNLAITIDDYTLSSLGGINVQFTVNAYDLESGIDLETISITLAGVTFTTLGTHSVTLTSFASYELNVEIANGDLDRGPSDQERSTYSTIITISDTLVILLILHSIEYYIQLLGYEADIPFIHPEENRRSTMKNKFEELVVLIQARSFRESYDKILHDIKPKLTGLKTDELEEPWGKEVFDNPWVVDPTWQEYLRGWVNSLLFGLKMLY